MKSVKVLGSGCTKCRNTVDLIEQVAAARGVAVNVEKVEDMQAIIGYGVMSTPAVVVDGEVVHAGGMPDRASVERWLGS